MWITQVMRTQSMETWGIWYIDESFIVWIISSRYQSHESIYCAHTTSFVASVHLIIWCLIMFQCVCSRHDFLCIFLIQIYQYTCACPCTPLDIHQITHLGVFNSPESACQDPRAWIMMDILWIRVAQRKRSGSAKDQSGTVSFQAPLLVSRVFLL